MVFQLGIMLVTLLVAVLKHYPGYIVVSIETRYLEPVRRYQIHSCSVWLKDNRTTGTHKLRPFPDAVMHRLLPELRHVLFSRSVKRHINRKRSKSADFSTDEFCKFDCLNSLFRVYPVRFALINQHPVLDCLLHIPGCNASHFELVFYF